MRQLLLCILLMVTIWSNSSSTTATRFVSDAGSDDSTGTSRTGAWATLDSAFARINRTDWYFDGYDMLELVLIDDAGDGAVFEPTATLEWGETDLMTLYMHADSDGQGGYDDVTVSGAHEIDEWRNYPANPDLDYATYSFSFTPAQPDFTNQPWLAKMTPWQPFLMRDMLIDDGTPFNLRSQVDVDKDELAAYEFTIDNNRMFVRANGISGGKANVGVVAPLLRIENAKGVYLAHLQFVESNPLLDDGMVEINAVDRVRIDTCSFTLSNRIGLRVMNSPREASEDLSCCDGLGVNLVGCTASNNGMIGMYFGNVHHLSMIGCTTNRNNWNGYDHGDLEYKSGGVILYNVEDATLLDHTANSNEARGGWIYGSQRVQVIDSEFKTNGFDGLTIDSCPSWICVSNCDFVGNATTEPEQTEGLYGAGVRNSIATPLSLFDCTLDGNDVQYMIGADVADTPFAGEDDCSFGGRGSPATSLILQPTNDSIIDVVFSRSAGEEFFDYDPANVDSLTFVNYINVVLQLDTTLTHP